MRLNCKYELISGDVLATLSAQILPDKNIKNKAIRFRGKFITIESDKQIVEEAIKTQLHKSAALARLKTSEIGNFNSIDQQVLFARQAMFVSTGENSFLVRIAGTEPSMGKVLIIKNTNNPNDLQIKADENLLQSSVDVGVFFVSKGEIVVTADRSFQPLNDLDSTKVETFVRLPSKDPDEVVLDGRLFRQTGTVCIQGQNIFMVLAE